jgi:hypothetical protein
VNARHPQTRLRPGRYPTKSTGKLAESGVCFIDPGNRDFGPGIAFVGRDVALPLPDFPDVQMFVVARCRDLDVQLFGSPIQR